MWPFSADTVLSVLPEPVRSMLPRPRRIQKCAGGLRIELRHVGGPGTVSAARVLEDRLRSAGVDRAEVNGALGCVFAGCDATTADLDKLTAIVDELDVDGARAGGPVALDGVQQQARTAMSLGLHVLGTGLALAGRVARLPSLPSAVPAVLSLAEHTPRIRRELERYMSIPTADAVVASTRLVSQTLAARPVSMLIDSVAAAIRFVDSCAGRRAWELREEEFADADGAYRHIQVVGQARPVPLPHGPVELYANAASAATVVTQAVTTVVGRNHEQGLSVLITGIPKAAHFGRDAFTSVLARALANRGGMVLHRGALGRIDRVDTVLLDTAALTTGGWTLDGIVPLGANHGTKHRTDHGANHGTDGDLDGGLDELDARIYTLLDLTDPAARRERDGWTAEPYSATREPAEVRKWRRQGIRPIRVSRQGTPVALVGVAPELHPLAEAVVAAAKVAGDVVLAGGEAYLGPRLGVDQVVDGGARLVAALRSLQSEGRVVAVVSRTSRRGLRQADLGIGVLRGAGRVPWDADVISDLDGIHLLLRCVPYAKRASRRSVRLAAAAGVVGAGLAVLGPAGTAVARANLVRDCTSVAALITGEWVGRNVRRTAPPVPADRTPWHAMAVGDVLALLRTSPHGLNEKEAERRRTKPARPEPTGPTSLAMASLEELANPLTPVLAAGAGLSASVGSVLDAVLIGGVMVVDAVIGGAQRRGADREVHRLTEVTAVRVRLRRPGGGVSGVADDLVKGDVIELRAGDAIPADGRLIQAVGLEIDESTLTGESQLVAKTAAPTVAAAVADRRSMVYEGTTVAAGHGLAVVVATGEQTEAGRTAGLAAEGRPVSGVELRLRSLSRRILPAAVGSGLVLMVTNLLRGSPLSAALAPAVSLAVAAVPEGLPFIATVAELASSKRLSQRNTLVRNPSTIEALGRVDVLCFDKTGTLTEGHISLRQVSDGGHARPLETLTPELKVIVGAALRAGPRFEGGRAIPHPTDRAVVEGAARLHVAPKDGLREWHRVDELPFEPARGYHAVLGLSESGHLLSVKGAPEVVLDRCTHLSRGGEQVPLGARTRRELEKEVERQALQGFRVLAVAERDASSRADLDESRIQRLCFLGFLCLADPVRPTATRSVDGLMRAGVRVIMITGDHPSTAEAIAAEIHVLNGQRVMTGPELEQLDDDALIKVLPEVAVFARTTPEHKARIVSCLRRAGKVVAVTGDGANDVPAIRLADIGIALGPRAVPAARAAADIVVIDDRIETIIDAISEGRAMWGSVRDALGILLGGNVGEIAFTVGSSLLSRRGALNARQLLLVNLLTDMLPAMAVAVRPPSTESPDKLLAEGPEVSLGTALTRDIYVRAVTTAAAATAAWLLGRMTGTPGRASTVGLIGLVGAQLLQTLSVGDGDRLVFLASVASLAALMVIISVPGLSQVFGCRPVGPFGWAIGLGCAVAAALMATVMERVSAE
ncbi:cation-translocating P-type ATPase [Nonomuraea aurantiaca]|uniref:cation-translocating P-type ATPase n=1 Tax=Nonomuraea aurantiaca TaxID=2878562 RepID=UPI001CD9B261|nr:cation-transporting P-type ATPase [Nonomuraea aurantiaca]MCA2227445.1 cation-transporting P-type ATPase [Nonomuraea aurantiaca]